MTLHRPLLFLPFLLIAFVLITHAQESCKLRITTVPESAEVVLDRRTVGWTPLVCGDLDIGTHYLEVRKPGYIPFRDTLRFDKRILFVRDIRLVAPGVLVVQSTPTGATVQVNGAEAGKTPLTISDLAPGFITLKAVKPGYGVSEQNLVVQEAETSNVSISLKGGTGELTLDVDPENAEVTLDSISIGVGPFAQRGFPSGKYRLAVRDPASGEEVSTTFFLPPGSRVHMKAEFGGFSPGTVVASALVPGFGQFSSGATAKGVAIMAGFAAVLGATIYTHTRYMDRRSTYESELSNYAAARTEAEALARHNDVAAAHDNLKEAYNTRKMVFSGLLALYALNVVDAYLFHSRTSGISVVPEPVSGLPCSPSVEVASQGFRFGLSISF
jgi:hypothetical protein